MNRKFLSHRRRYQKRSPVTFLSFHDRAACSQARRAEVRAAQAGFSMMETLIAILVLSLGIFGAGWLQLTAVRTVQQSSYQTTALQLAAEMADRIRANRNPAIFLAVDYDAAVAPAIPASAGCYGAHCDGSQMASFEIADWLARASAVLPGLKTRICRDTAPWDAAAQALSWQCSEPVDDAAPLVIKLGWRVRNPDGSTLLDNRKDTPPGLALTVMPYLQ
jgi:type IV pilus assembly protein PilV